MMPRTPLFWCSMLAFLLTGCGGLPVDVGVTWSRRPQWSVDTCIISPALLRVQSGWPLSGSTGGYVGGEWVWGRDMAACSLGTAFG